MDFRISRQIQNAFEAGNGSGLFVQQGSTYLFKSLVAGSGITIVGDDASLTISSTASGTGGTGPQGPPGPSGLPGSQGPIGPSGMQGIQGIQGVSGPSGSVGPSGLRGPTGPSGSQGIPGTIGPSGIQGPPGPSGLPGASGLQGPQGIQGNTGPSGLQGIQGPSGLQGIQGVTGPSGAQGIAGPSGMIGPQGPIGATGPSGSSTADPQLRTDFTNASGNWVKTASNTGASGVGLFKQKVLSDLQFKKLVAGNNVTFITSPDSIRISSTDTGEVNTASNIGNGVGVFDSKSGVDLRFRKILGGSGIEVRASGQTIILDNELSDDFIELNNKTDKIRTDFTNSSGVFTNTDTKMRLDFSNASGVWVKDGVNLGIGSGVFIQKNSGQILEFKTILPGSGIDIVGSGNNLIIKSITAGSTGEANTASNIGLGIGVFDSKVGVDLRFKRLLGGSGIEISTSGSTIRFDNEIVDDFNILKNNFTNSSGVFVKTASNQGLGKDVFGQKIGQDLQFHRLLQGSGIIISASGNTLRIDNMLVDDLALTDARASKLRTDFTNSSGVFTSTDAKMRTDFTNASGLWVKTASNVGSSGVGVFKQKTGSNLDFKKLVPGTNVTFITSADSIRISSTDTGEANTASNVGSSSGIGVFDSKVGVDLRFRKLLGGSGIEIRASGQTIVFDNELSDDFEALRNDFTNSSGTFVKTASNQGIGQNVFGQKVGQDLQFHRLLQGSGIIISASGNTLRLDNTLVDDIALTDARASKLRTDFTNSSGIFQEGTNEANQTRIDFDNASGVWVKDGLNLGAGKNVFKQKNASKQLEFRSLSAGSGIQLTENTTGIIIDNTIVDDLALTDSRATKLRLDFTNSSGVFANTDTKMRLDFTNASGIWVKNAQNVGIGSGLFVQKNANKVLEFKSLIPGSGIKITGSGLNLRLDVTVQSSSGSGGGEANTASNIGLGVGVFDSKSGVDLRFKKLLGGSGIEVRASGSTIRFDNELSDDFVLLNNRENKLRLDFDNASGIWVKTASNVGASGTGIFKQKSGSDLQFKQLVEGTRILFVTSPDSIRIKTNAELNTASNTGSSGVGVFAQKSVEDLQFKKLVAGTNITFITSSDSIRINGPASVGEINTASNLGASGVGVFSSKSGVDLRFKSLVGQLPITVHNDSANTLTIRTTAEANTASNVGSSGVGLFKQKSGVDLQFKKLVAGDNITFITSPDSVRVKAASANPNIKEVKLNFTSTLYQTSKQFVITDSDVTTSSQLIMTQSFSAPSGKDQDENEMDAFNIRCVPGSGQFTAYIESLFGPVVDSFTFNYLVG